MASPLSDPDADATSLTSLPAEAIALIVELTGGNRLPRVCKDLRAACLRAPAFRVAGCSAAALLAAVEPRREHLLRLSVSRVALSGEDLLRILSLCPLLRELEIAHVRQPGIDLSEAGASREPFPALRMLKVTNSLVFNLGFLTARLPALAALEVASALDFCEADLEQMEGTLASPSFRSLSLTGCPAVHDLSLSIIARHARHLESLNLSGCAAVSDGGVTMLMTQAAAQTAEAEAAAAAAAAAAGAPPTGSPAASPTGADAAAEAGHAPPADAFGFAESLHTLRLAGCKRIAWPGVAAVLANTRLRALRHISLSGVDDELLSVCGLRPASVAEAAERWRAATRAARKSGTAIGCSGAAAAGSTAAGGGGAGSPPGGGILGGAAAGGSSSGVSDAAAAAAAALRSALVPSEGVSVPLPGGAVERLRSLELTQSSISDGGLLALAGACPQLRVLRVRWCTLVSDAAAEPLLRVAAPRLAELRFDACKRVHAPSVAALRAAFPSTLLVATAAP